jgi:hypothetical protein
MTGLELDFTEFSERGQLASKTSTDSPQPLPCDAPFCRRRV